MKQDALRGIDPDTLAKAYAKMDEEQELLRRIRSGDLIVVPRVPNEKMKNAGADAFVKAQLELIQVNSAARIYTAMIAAAGDTHE